MDGIWHSGTLSSVAKSDPPCLQPHEDLKKLNKNKKMVKKPPSMVKCRSTADELDAVLLLRLADSFDAFLASQAQDTHVHTKPYLFLDCRC